uniref:Uncharacterized protein n=1 Tax=Oryza nivara TaxID=4536 RepID=A0A0E0GSJ6_ORYNI
MEDELVSLSFFFPVLLLVARLVRQDREKSLRLPGYPVGWSRWLVKPLTRFSNIFFKAVFGRYV